MLYPRYSLIFIPVLVACWTHWCCERRRQGLLLVSLLLSCLPLIVLAEYQGHLCTAWHPDGFHKCGLHTNQIPLSVVVTALVAMLPVKARLWRNLAAILVGECLLLDTWIV